MAFKKNNKEKKFWDEEPDVIYEFEKGRQTVKCVIGKIKGETKGGLQFVKVTPEGVEIPMKNIVFSEVGEVYDMELALNELESVWNKKLGKKKTKEEPLNDIEGEDDEFER